MTFSIKRKQNNAKYIYKNKSPSMANCINCFKVLSGISKVSWSSVPGYRYKSKTIQTLHFTKFVYSVC